MFFNRLTYPLVLAVLLVAGLAFIVTPATAAPDDVKPVLSVPDDVPDVGDNNDPTQGIQVYGLRAEPVSFDLTVTFIDDKGTPDDTTDDSNTPVTGFDVSDIVLQGLDSNNNPVLNGATADRLTTTDSAVWTTKISVKDNVNKVNIAVPKESARTQDDFSNNGFVRGILVPTEANGAVTESVEIVRSAAPPLTLTPDKLVRGDTPFTVTLTSTKPITLRGADLKVTDGYLDSITPDAARRVWTLTIVPLPGRAEITVEAASGGAYIFPKGTFTVDTTGPVATIAGAPALTGGPFPMTIAFNEPLQAGTTLLASEINVTGGTITSPTPIPGSNVYSAILTPDQGATTVTVQVNTGAVADAGGVANAATPSPAHIFQVTPTATSPGTTPGRGSGDVTISEIMFATNGGTNDIQWIELFNSSKTQTVALDAGAGWELIIENYDDPRSTREPLSGTINFKDSGRVKTILPRQTVLIVSSNGRNSGNTYRDRRQHFVPTRVFDVYSELATDEFGMRTRRDPFLHPTKGFHIELIDGRDTLVDEVGNLTVRGRTTDELSWTLPSGWTEDDDRTSIIRRYRKDAAYDGTQRTGWIPAAETSFLYLSRKRLVTWYGLSTDHGSPGIRAGGELPVELSQFRPDRTETGTVVIHWTTEAEVDNAGFNILRGQTRTGEFKVINAQLIPGAGTTAERNTYTWTDTTAKPNLVYYYQIEDVSLDGERQTLATVRLRGLVSAKGKLTTQWGQLKRLRD
ncbi:MAG: Ig-like domain-containing protein [Candidatus Poribacteria bacterium]|nr:Ig-like domain-containing protein [Candidatus Poribacteria bacterium]